MEWINKNIDKVAHVFVSFFLVFYIELILRIFGYDQPVPLASIATCFIGFGKEVYDDYKRSGAGDWKDLVADVVGVLLANIYFYASIT